MDSAELEQMDERLTMEVPHQKQPIEEEVDLSDYEGLFDARRQIGLEEVHPAQADSLSAGVSDEAAYFQEQTEHPEGIHPPKQPRKTVQLSGSSTVDPTGFSSPVQEISGRLYP